MSAPLFFEERDLVSVLPNILERVDYDGGTRHLTLTFYPGYERASPDLILPLPPGRAPPVPADLDRLPSGPRRRLVPRPSMVFQTYGAARLGHRFEQLIAAGDAKDYVAIARLSGLSRARVTQITISAFCPP